MIACLFFFGGLLMSCAVSHSNLGMIPSALDFLNTDDLKDR